MSFNNSSFNTTNTQIYEILAYANELISKDKDSAILYLRNNRSRVIIEGYLKMNYDPSIVFQLPPGQPPFKKQLDVPDGYCLTDLKQEFRRMRIFTDAQMNISKLRREQLWIQMCEGLFWKEADLIAKIKDRRITDIYNGFTAEFVREVFPGSIPEVVAEPIPEELVEPVDFGEDPSKISEEELFKLHIPTEFFEKEVDVENKVVLDFDDWKKAFFVPPTQDVIEQLNRFHNIDIDKEVEIIAKYEYEEYLKKLGAVAQKKVTAPAKRTRKPSTKSQQKSTERKTALSKRPVINKNGEQRKKPGRKPKEKISS